MNWKVTAFCTIVLSIGTLAGCQPSSKSNQMQKAAVHSTNNRMAIAGNRVGNSESSTTGNPDSTPMAVKSEGMNGPVPIHITKTSILSFTGTPTVTSTSAASAAAPIFVGNNTGYAALNGEVIKTLDGGQNWNLVGRMDGDIQSIAFSSPSDGLAAVQNGGEITKINQSTTQYTWSIYRTIDGGKTWTKVWTKSVNEPQETYMSGNFHFSMFGLTGYALLAGNLLTTQDGGQTWDPIVVSGQVGYAAVTGANNLWIVTSAAQQSEDGSTTQGPASLLHSADGGKHFQLAFQTAPMMLWQTRLAFDSSRNGILLVKDLGNWATTAYWTTDAGETWQHSQPQAYGGRIAQSEPVFGSSGVAYIALDPGAAPFSGGVTTFDVKTGKTNQVWQNGDWRDAQVGAVQGSTIYAAASLNEGGKAIFRSTDNGKDWSQVYPAGVPNIQVQFLSQGVGYGLGMDETSGYIYKTTDGGRKWTTLKTMHGLFPNAIAFVNSKTAYVSAYAPDEWSRAGNGYKVQLLVTYDGGMLWSIVAGSQIPSAAAKGVDMPNIQARLSASGSGVSMVIDSAYPTVVLTSRDSKTWKQVTVIKSDLGIDALAYANPNDLWVSSVSQNHVSTKNNPSIYTSTIYQVGGMEPSEGPSSPLWALPEGWAVLGMARPSEQDAYIYAVKSLYLTSGAALFATHDNGKTWTEYVQGGAKGSSSARVTAGASNPSLVPEPLDLFPSGSIVDLSFVNANAGYMLTANGLLKTTDGGATWIYVR